MFLKHKARHILVVGRSGSGKTGTLVQLASDSRYDKVFIFDPDEEFAARIGSSVHLTTSVEGAFTKKKIVCVSPVDYGGFDDFCSYCFAYQEISRKPALMIVDELQLHVNNHNIPDSFVDALVRGRKFQLDIAFATHQPNMLHNFIRPQITEIFAFGSSDLAMSKYLDNFGFNTDELMELPDLEYRHKIVGGKVTIGKVSI